MLETNKIYCADCIDLMKEMEDNSVDLVLTDPPYGIKRDLGFGGAVGFRGEGKPINRSQYNSEWDNYKPNEEYFNNIQRVSKNQIIFGGNFFTDVLPVSNHWMCWDKNNTMPTFGDGELCWTSFSNKNSIKIYKYQWNGLLQEDMKHKEKRFHPTQKPIKLIEKIIKDYSKAGMTIFDPFLGSGTTAIACINTERNFIGIEKDKEYFEIAEKRIKEAQNQNKLSDWF